MSDVQEIAVEEPQIQPFDFTAGFVEATPYDDLYTEGDHRLTAKERAERDKREAEEIYEKYYNGTIFRLPKSGKELRIHRLPEAAWRKFIYLRPEAQLPPPPMKKASGNSRKQTPDYDNKGYQASLEAYTSHNENVLNVQVGKMFQYICSAGIEILDKTHYSRWKEHYKQYLPPGHVEEEGKLRFSYLTELCQTDPVWKAVLIAVCGYDPLAAPEEDDN